MTTLPHPVDDPKTESLFGKQHVGSFRLRVAPGTSRSWVREVVEHLDTVQKVQDVPRRRRGFVDLPYGSSSTRAFIKIFHHTSRRHSKWRRRTPVQRLRRRYADHEGRALRHLADAGISVPKLLFYGEEWILGVRRRGVVATEALAGSVLSEVLGDKPHNRLTATYGATLARIHTTGLSHGDAHAGNFLVQDSRLTATDFENSRALTRKKRTSDLVTMISSVLDATHREESAFLALSSYLSAGGDTCRQKR